MAQTPKPHRRARHGDVGTKANGYADYTARVTALPGAHAKRGHADHDGLGNGTVTPVDDDCSIARGAAPYGNLMDQDLRRLYGNSYRWKFLVLKYM